MDLSLIGRSLLGVIVCGFILCCHSCSKIVKDSNFAIKDYIHDTKNGVVFQKADSFKNKRQFDQSLVEFNGILANKRLNEEQRIYAFNQVTYLHLKMHQDSQATLCMKKTEALFRNIEEFSKGAQADYWLNKGMLAYRSYSPKYSQSCLSKAIALYEGIYGKEKHLKSALAYHYLGMEHFSFEKKIPPFYRNVEKAYEIIQADSSLWEHGLESELGMMYSCLWKRNYETAKIHCQNVIFLAKKQSPVDSFALASAICVKGRFLRYFAGNDQKKLKAAIDTLRASIKMIKPFNSPLEVEFYRHLAVAYFRKKDSTLFFNIIKEIVNLEKKLPLRLHLSSYILARYYFVNKNFDTSIRYANDFLKEHEQDSTLSEQILDDCYKVLSDDYIKKDNFYQAYVYFIKNLVHDTKLSGKKISPDEVFNPDVYSESSFPFWTLSHIGDLFHNQYKINGELDGLIKAIEAFKRSDRLMFTSNSDYDEDFILNIFPEIGQIYTNALNAVYLFDSLSPNNNNNNNNNNKQYLDLAAHFFDRSKADILYRYLPDNMPFEDVRDLKMSINEAEMKKGQASWSENRQHAHAVYKLSKIKTGLSQRYHLLKSSDIQNKLGHKESVLQYKLDNEFIYLLYIDKGQVILKRQKISSDSLKALVTEMKNGIDTLDNRYYQPFINSSYQLYQLLLAPFAQQIDKHPNCTIIPDGVLHQVPFEALLTRKVEQLNKHSPFFIKSNNSLTIAYTPAWKIRENNLKNKPQKINNIAFFYYGPGLSDKEGLYCSPNEIKAAQKTYHVDSFSGRNCTKKVFFQEWRNNKYQAYHFSLHAGVDQLDPLNAKIWLGPGRTESLLAYEIGRHKRSAELVILSACSSATGNINPGEGAYSLSRGFFQSGAKSVMAALWEIKNCNNADLIEYFYTFKKEGNDSALAISKAKRAYLAVGKDIHPRYWAGTVLIH
jgi:CHAT domain-containing protein